MLLAVLLVLNAVVVLRLNRRMSFYSDDWHYVFSYGWSPESIVRPDNGHLPVLAKLTWNSVMGVFGIESYLPFAVLGTVFVTLAAVSVWWYGTQRCSPQVGLVLAAGLVTLGSSFHVLLWPLSGLGLVPLAALPASLLLLDARRRGADVLVLVLIAVSVLAGGYGLIVPAAVAFDLLLRRDWRRLLALVVPPMAVLLAWLTLLGSGSGASAPGADLGRLALVPTYVVQSIVAGTGSLFGHGAALATLAAAAYAALLVWLLRRNPAPDHVRMASLTSAAVVFAALVRLARDGDAEPGAPRYLAFLAVPLALVLVEAARGVNLPPHGRRLLVAGFLVCVAGNASQLLQSTANFGFLGDVQRGQLTALELSRDSVLSSYQPSTEGMQRFNAGAYFASIDRFGSPGFTPAELAAAPEHARSAADQVMVEVGMAEIVETEALPCEGSSTVGEQVRPGEQLLVVAPAGTEIRLWRFAATPPAEPALVLADAGAAVISTRADEASPAWRVSFSVPALTCP